jgi:hypothetical protein
VIVSGSATAQSGRARSGAEEAVDYSRKVLDAAGISHIPAELVPQEVAIKRGRVNKLFSEILGRPMVELVVRPRLMPITEGISSQMLRALVEVLRKLLKLRATFW